MTDLGFLGGEEAIKVNVLVGRILVKNLCEIPGKILWEQFRGGASRTVRARMCRRLLAVCKQRYRVPDPTESDSPRPKLLDRTIVSNHQYAGFASPKTNIDFWCGTEYLGSVPLLRQIRIGLDWISNSVAPWGTGPPKRSQAAVLRAREENEQHHWQQQNMNSDSRRHSLSGRVVTNSGPADEPCPPVPET